MLVRAQTALLGRARTSVVIATEIGIGIAQNTSVIVAERLVSFAMLEPWHPRFCWLGVGYASHLCG